MPLITRGKDNLKNFMQTGFVTNNNISVTQTGDNGYFRAGINHIYNKGQFPNQTLKITNFTMSGEMRAGNKFSLKRIWAIPVRKRQMYGDRATAIRVSLPDINVDRAGV